MTENDDAIGATSELKTHKLAILEGVLDLEGKVLAGKLSATKSMTDAMLSVTSAVSRQEFDNFAEQVRRLEMPTHRLLAEGTLKPEDINIKTALSADVARAMAVATYQDRERNDTRKHDKALANSNADGASKAVVKWTLVIVAAVLLAVLSWGLGKYS
jgi:hypothetical protein